MSDDGEHSNNGVLVGGPLEEEAELWEHSGGSDVCVYGDGADGWGSQGLSALAILALPRDPPLGPFSVYTGISTATG